MGKVNDGVIQGNRSSKKQAGVVRGRGCLVEGGTRRLITGSNRTASGCALGLTHDPQGHWGHSSSRGSTVMSVGLSRAFMVHLLCSWVWLFLCFWKLLLLLCPSELHYFVWIQYCYLTRVLPKTKWNRSHPCFLSRHE